MPEMKFWFGASAISPDELSSPEHPIVLNIRIKIDSIEQNAFLDISKDTARDMIIKLTQALKTANDYPSSRRAISDADGL